MIARRQWPLVWRQVVRRQARTVLTVSGVAVAMFLYCAVQILQQGVDRATQRSAADTTLVVYRENRFCPFASRLPQWYADRIKTIDGVTSVLPMRVVVNNCNTSLDVVTFRGVPTDQFLSDSRTLRLASTDADRWTRRSDAALVGRSLASRRGLRPGDTFDAAGVTAYVAAILDSDEPQDQNVAYVDLGFLQNATDRRPMVREDMTGQPIGSAAGGVVTQFNVRVADPSRLDEVARTIDDMFAREQDPTFTSPEKAFVARAASEIVSLVGFTRWLGFAALAAVLALMANAIVLSVQDRIREHAVLQTLGFNRFLIGRLIVAEGLLLSLMGGVLGAGAALIAANLGHFAISAEGLSVTFSADVSIFLTGLLVSCLLGVVAGLVPAWQASQRDIVSCFRSV